MQQSKPGEMLNWRSLELSMKSCSEGGSLREERLRPSPWKCPTKMLIRMKEVDLELSNEYEFT